MRTLFFGLGIAFSGLCIESYFEVDDLNLDFVEIRYEQIENNKCLEGVTDEKSNYILVFRSGGRQKETSGRHRILPNNSIRRWKQCLSEKSMEICLLLG